MANLLPTKELSMLRAQRRHRLRSAALVLVSGMFAFSTVLLVPSVIALLAAKESGKEWLETTRRLVALQEHAEAGADIAITKDKMEILIRNEAAVAPHELIERITSLLPPGVSLNTINFTRQEASVSLDLSGEAANRNALISFGEVLKGSGLFADVVVPIEALAPATDLQFRLSLTLAENALN